MNTDFQELRVSLNISLYYKENHILEYESLSARGQLGHLKVLLKYWPYGQ